MTPATIINVLVVGLMRGGLYALMATGLALLLGVMKVANFAHGEFYMVGAYMAYFAFAVFGLPPWLAILMAALAGMLTGVLVERIFFHPLRLRSKEEWLTNSFLVALGISVLMQNLALILWSAQPRGIIEFWKGSVQLSPNMVAIPLDRVVAFFVAIVGMVALWLVLEKTKVGRAIRAVAQDQRGAMLLGINPLTVYALTFGISGLLAAIAGGSLLSITAAYPFMGVPPLFKSYFVVVIAGFGSIEGSVVAAFAFGIVESFVFQWFGSGWPEVVGILITIAVLLVKPAGLFAKRAWTGI
jgi:branched-chain amino acid transport system permease protein